MARMTRWHAIVASAMLALSPACVSSSPAQKSDAPAPPAPPVPEQPQPAAAPAPTVTLLEPGAEPRTPLRLTFNEGAAQEIDLFTQASTQQSIGVVEARTQPTPAFRVRLRTRITKVEENGDANVELRFIDADALPAPGVPAESVAMNRTSLRRLIGTIGTAVLTPRGLTRSMSLKLPEGLEDAYRQGAHELLNTLGQMSLPLPEEPVGLGGKWKAEADVVSGPVTIRQAVTYTLTAVKDGQLVVDASLSQTAGEQAMSESPLTGGAMRMTSLSASGSGTIRQALHRVLPGSATMSLKSTMQILVDMGLEIQKLTKRSDATMSIRAVEPSAPAPATPVPQK